MDVNVTKNEKKTFMTDATRACGMGAIFGQILRVLTKPSARDTSKRIRAGIFCGHVVNTVSDLQELFAICPDRCTHVPCTMDG